jgi:hypothetical protein
MLVPSGSTNAVLNRHRHVLPFSELRIYEPSLSLFPSNILYFPLIAPPGVE